MKYEVSISQNTEHTSRAILLRQMKRANNARCPKYMASYRTHNITELESLFADMRNIDCIE